MEGCTMEIEIVKKVNGRFDVSNQWWSYFRPTEPQITSLSTEEASTIKCRA